MVGGGAYSDTAYFSEAYTQSFLANNFHITSLEALNLIHALTFLLPKSPNAHIIVVNTDSKVAQQVLETGKGRDKMLTACSRQLWYLAAKYQTEIRIVHKAGDTLVLADALSRRTTERLKIKGEEMCRERKLRRIRIEHSKDILIDI